MDLSEALAPKSAKPEGAGEEAELAALKARLARLEARLDEPPAGLHDARAALLEARRAQFAAERRAAALEARLEALEAAAPPEAAAEGPRLRRLVTVAWKLVWWTATFQLPQRLRARREFFAARRLEAAAPPATALALAAPEAVDIVVCVHNALDDVRRCLSSVLACTLPPYRLIIVDDGSAEPTRDLLAAFARDHRARLVRNEAARGYTFAANQGMRLAESPWIVLLNSDTVVTLGWLDRMKAQANASPRTGIVGPLSNIASWQSVPEISTGGDWPENPLPDDVDVARMGRLMAEALDGQGAPLPFMNGFCLLLRKAMLDEVGLFDEETFGAGYGEENDLCIRARNAGWGLAVAADAFVFHAQSKSYSHERRRQLASRADEALAAKHDPAQHIWPQVGFCMRSLAMAGFRARVEAAIERRRLIEEGCSRWEGRRLAVILPLAAPAGGGEVVIQEAKALRRMGVDVWLINLGPAAPRFEAAFPGHDLPVIYAEEAAEVAAVLSDPAYGFDAVIATLYLSVYWLPKTQPGLVRAYYIQDYEPLFFEPGDPEREVALHSYRSADDLVLFTKTSWNAAQVEAGGAPRPAVVGASVDLDLFRPEPAPYDQPHGAPRVCAMVRPSTARRGHERTLTVLRRLKDRFGVEISVFGVSAREAKAAGIDLSGMRCLGELDRRGMADLLARSDVFLDLSDYQAMGLTALEAMASGCAVVVPAEGGAGDFARHEENALVVDTTDVEACAAAAERLVADEELRHRLQLRAIADVARLSPERAALRIMETLFG